MSEVVVLRGGVSVLAGALRLAWKLEKAGCTLTVDGDELVVRPARLVSLYDRELLRQWRDDLVTIVRYEPPAEGVQ